MPKSGMERSLFEEPTDEIMREDPFSGPKGFMIGGMALPNKLDLALEYYKAANILIEQIQNNRIADYEIANPVLFLYRHGLEVAIKGLMPKQKNIHDLSDLVDKLAKFYRDQGHPQLPKWVSLRLKEIAAIDPGSTAFRYAENFDKSQKRPVPVEGELYISVNHLHMVMDLLFSFFTGAYANISTGPL